MSKEKYGEEGENAEGRVGVCSAGPCLHTVCPGLAFTSTEDHCKLIVALGKHLQAGKGSCFSKMAGSTWVATIVVVQVGGAVPSPPTQRMQYLLLDNQVHHFQGGLQVAVTMTTRLRHTGADIHTEHMQVLWQTRVL